MKNMRHSNVKMWVDVWKDAKNVKLIKTMSITALTLLLFALSVVITAAIIVPAFITPWLYLGGIPLAVTFTWIFLAIIDAIQETGSKTNGS